MPEISSNPKTESVNVRMLPEIKEEAERIFGFHGLTLSEAIAVFIKHSCYAGGFPFELRPAPYTDIESLEALKEADQLANDTNAKTFKTVEAMRKDIMKGDDNG